MSDKLLSDVKNYLDITWNDEATDLKLNGIIDRGQAYLKNISGNIDLSFDVENDTRSLLMDYCRYARSNALEAFEKNFKSQLIALRIGEIYNDQNSG